MMAVVDEVVAVPWFFEEMCTELAGLYGSGEAAMPGPFSVQSYCRSVSAGFHSILRDRPNNAGVVNVFFALQVHGY